MSCIREIGCGCDRGAGPGARMLDGGPEQDRPSARKQKQSEIQIKIQSYGEKVKQRRKQAYT